MITFAYPGYNPTNFFTMHDPDRDDVERDISEISLHITKGGTFKTTIKRDCIVDNEKELNFSSVCDSKLSEFVSFVKNAGSHYIKYTDHDGKNWITQLSEKVINISKTPTGNNISITLLAWEP